MASKPNTARQHKHFAVLIDADNAPAAIVEGLFEEIAKYGVASVKRIYGDWTQPNLGSWEKCCSIIESSRSGSPRIRGPRISPNGKPRISRLQYRSHKVNLSKTPIP